MKRAPRRIDQDRLKGLLGCHLAMYRTKTPHYQAAMLDTLLDIWKCYHSRLLDIGGGTGVIAEAIAKFFPVGSVVTVDVADRFCSTLSVETRRYDGHSLPFCDSEFDAATLNNVLHHVPVDNRPHLLREIRRVVRGPLYVKDHESRSILDDLRLTALDAIGNIPFGGMLWARYFTMVEWEQLAESTGYEIAAVVGADYRATPYDMAFPNRLEVTMRFEPKASAEL